MILSNVGLYEYEKNKHKYNLSDIPNIFVTIRRIKYWKTNDGINIKFCDISDTHLDNIINFLRKKTNKNQYIFDILLLEKKFRKLNFIIVPNYS